jgi:hypothetical protein
MAQLSGPAESAHTGLSKLVDQAGKRLSCSTDTKKQIHVLRSSTSNIYLNIDLEQKPMDNINAGWSGEPPNKSFHKQCPECPERQQHNLLQKQKSREIEHWSLQNLRTPSRSSEEGDMETLKYHIFWSTMYL